MEKWMESNIVRAFTLTAILMLLCHEPACAGSLQFGKGTKVALSECEGDRNCATWEFIDGKAHAQWSDGISADLNVVRSDAESVVIIRTDAASGTTNGQTALYQGVLIGNHVLGVVIWSWQGHLDKGYAIGDWTATLVNAPLSASDATPAAGAPTQMHLCHANSCSNIERKGNHYENQSRTAFIVRSFTHDSVVLLRSDPPNQYFHRGLTFAYRGTMTDDGKSMATGLQYNSWGNGGGPGNPFRLSWGQDLAALPASGPPPSDGKALANRSAAEGGTPAWYQALSKLAAAAIAPDANPIDAAHSGGGPEPAKPVFLEDKVFTFDLSGEWRLTYPASSAHHPAIDVVVVSKGSDFQLIVGVPNIFYPAGESMFNGRYVDMRTIRGEQMDAPAHRGDGYRGYAWSKADIEIVDPNNLKLGEITLKRLSGELGANKLCDTAKYANIPNAAANMFIYATKDLGLRNYGNGACWLYISAHQGHHEAARELALLLHNGSGVQKDLGLSFLWLRKSAGEGNKAAQRLLADYYKLGIGVAADPSLAQAALAKANDRSPEPALPQTQGEKEAGLVGWFSNYACQEPARLRAEHADRVDTYESRSQRTSQRGHEQAEDRATDDEADAQFLCDSLHGYHPPPMPKSLP
jgi:hypothetical protein